MELTSSIKVDVKTIEAIENLNVAKILVRNFGTACTNLGVELVTKDERTVDTSEVTITSVQLLKFLVKLIEENDKLKSSLTLK